MSNDAQVRQQAIAWYARLCSGSATDADRAAWARWHDADDAHRQAWRKLERLRESLQGLPRPLALPVLRAGQAARSRRRTLRGLLIASAAGGGGWIAWRGAGGRALLADYRTAPGERRTLNLADGSRVVMNTRSALDVRFDERQRELIVVEGEILVQTAAARGDAAGGIEGGRDPRPLFVSTPHGRIDALGTRFGVRLHDARTSVSVFEHAVRLRPLASSDSRLLRAGEQGWFGAREIGAAGPADADAAAWTQGSLVVDDRPLSDVIAELARYRRGRLGCEPAVATLRVSGAFPLDDTDRALALIAKSLPVRIVRTTRFWVMVAPI